MPSRLAVLCALIATLFALPFHSALAKQPLKVTINIYNLTGEPHELKGHNAALYGSYANFAIKHDDTANKMSHKPSTITIQPKEKGRMYRMQYHVKSSKMRGCILDFVIRWSIRNQRYTLDNITVNNAKNTHCPMSPVKHDDVNNHSRFSMALIHS